METVELFISNFLDMFLDMSFYIMIGLLFVGILSTYIKRDKILGLLGKDNFASVVKASAIGVPLPLCSCGVVPTAVELKKNGASNGSVVSFLVSTPQTGVDSIFATYSMMGIVMAIFRPVAAFISGIITGLFVNIFAKHDVINVAEAPASCCSQEKAVETTSCCSQEKAVETTSCCSQEKAVETTSCCCSHTEVEETIEVAEESCCCSGKSSTELNAKQKFFRVFTYAYGEFLDEIAVHFIVGMFLATIIATFVPADFFISLGLSSGILSMFCMMLIGLPMYICSTSSIPIVLSLITKGLSLGSAFVFLFTGPVTNIASVLVLSKTLGKKITSLYIGMVIICSIAFGLLLDFLVAQFSLDILSNSAHVGHHGEGHYLYLTIATIFALLLTRCFIIRIKAKLT